MPVFSDEEIRTTDLFGAGSETLIGIFAPHDVQLTPAFASILPLNASEECTLIPSTLGMALSKALNTVCLLNGNSASPELLTELINPPRCRVVAHHMKRASLLVHRISGALVGREITLSDFLDS
jgi:hypothetical protein